MHLEWISWSPGTVEQAVTKLWTPLRTNYWTGKSCIYVIKACIVQDVLERTFDVGVIDVAVGLVSARLLWRAASRAGYAVALGVTHVGSADAAAVRAQELVSTSAVLAWHTNARFSINYL
jgi:hypothetical protein